MKKSITNTKLFTSLSSYLRWVLSKFLTILPSGSPEFLYTNILKPRIVKDIVNHILKLVIPKEIKTKEGVFLELDRADPVVSGALALGVYERYGSELFRSEIKTGMTVIDIGANLGHYAAIASRLTGEQGLVVAFEPEPNFFKLLSKNISRNDMKNVACFELAIAEKNGLVNLHISNENKGNNSIIYSGESETFVQVKTTTLDDFLVSQKITKVDIIKMDIEGAEILALEGMKNTLIKHQPLLFLEFSPYSILKTNRNPIDFLSTLHEIGYSIFEINKTRQRLDKLTNFQKFIESMPRGKYADLYCKKIAIFPSESSREAISVNSFAFIA